MPAELRQEPLTCPACRTAWPLTVPICTCGYDFSLTGVAAEVAQHRGLQRRARRWRRLGLVALLTSPVSVVLLMPIVGQAAMLALVAHGVGGAGAIAAGLGAGAVARRRLREAEALLLPAARVVR